LDVIEAITGVDYLYVIIFTIIRILFHLKHYIYITALVKHTINVDTLIRNLLGNIVLFIPMGWYVPVIYKKQYSFKDAVWKMCGVIIFTELIQLISMRGTYDIDDIILRVTGFCIGTVLWESKVGKKMSILVNGCGE
jgi:hypothetical protein